MPKKWNEMGLENTIVTILTKHILPQPIPINLSLHDPNDDVCVTPTSSCYAKIITCHVIPILHGKHTNNMSCNMSQACQHRMFFPLRFMFCGTFCVHVPQFSFSNFLLVLLHHWSFRSLNKISILLASLILQQLL
jgi:hypothetical protein